MSAQVALISGNRLHLQHGPIDLVIGADGDAAEVRKAYRMACEVFPSILPKLVEELGVLRAPMRSIKPGVLGAVAARMVEAVWPHRGVFITPMAAVAGSVAEYVLERMLAASKLRRAYVNNGGDIALHLEPDATYAAGVVGDLSTPRVDGHVTLRACDGIAGIATSGWRGRSLSLGIADAVTILAKTAAAADAAATIVANAVVVDDPAIVRRPAGDVRDDSDLGEMPVTVDVGPLSPSARQRALESGSRKAGELIDRRLIKAAYLQLQGEVRVAGVAERSLQSSLSLCRKRLMTLEGQQPRGYA